MSRRAAVAVVCGLVAATSSTPTAAGARQERRQASEVESALRAGRPQILPDNTTIYGGDLDLRGAGVRSAFVCKRCTILGGLRASHARFERGIDFSGSTVRGEVDLDGAVFSAAALFGAPSHQDGGTYSAVGFCTRSGDRPGALFGNDVELAFATFEDIADFEGVTFCGDADLTSARFRAMARFANAEFHSTARFAAAAFERGVSFSNAAFDRDIDFTAATFGGVADFRQSLLGSPTRLNSDCGLCFQDAVFRERGDFSNAQFNHPAIFRDARFGADAVFRDTVFDAEPGEVGKQNPIVTFDHSTVGGRLELDGAKLKSSAELRSLSAATLSLPKFDPRFTLAAEGVSIGRLFADIDSIDHVREERDRMRLLRLLESSAKERGDLRLANDAHFHLQELAAEDDGLPRRIADWALYKNVAGYLVRPLRPLEWLVGIVLFATLLRAYRLIGRRSRSARSGRSSSHSFTVSTLAVPAHSGRTLVRRQTVPVVAPTTSGATGAGHGFGRTLITAFALTVAGRPEPSPLRRAELVIYVLLITCVLIAVANTNPTLRDMIDTIR